MEKTKAADSPKKLAIIDGKSVFYRGYYAMPNLSTKDGTPTGGVFGFATMALEVIKRLKPDYVAVAWDKPKTNIRKRLAIYPAYKAGRKPPPPDFYDQIPVLHELLSAFGWPLYELDDYEADDIMGTLARQASEQNIETLLITSDLDLLQVVGPKTKVYALKTGLSNIELYSPVSFEAKYQIKLDQFLDYKALIGDSSDNIPGVPGVGPVAARKLLAEYGTLDKIYEEVDLISGRVGQNLVNGKQSALMSKELAAIWTDAPITLNLDEVDGSKCRPDELLAMLKKLEFSSLVRQLPEIMQTAVEAHTGGTLPGVQSGKTVIIHDDAGLEAVKLDAKQVIIHGRSAGKHGRNPRLLILSADPKLSYVLDLAKLSPKVVTEVLARVLKDSSLVGYDVKSALQILIGLGVPLPPVHHDVLIGAFVLNSLRREQSLTELAASDTGYDGAGFDNLSDEELVEQASAITSVIRTLLETQTKDLVDTPKLTKLAADIEWPIIPVLARMEYRGIQLDADYLDRFASEINDTISDLEQQIYGHADHEFNIGSPSQLADILFETLALPKQGIKKGKTGLSTAASELDKLRGQHPIIDLITQYREVMKLKNTYVDTLPKLVDDESRVHTTFNLTVAQTGRLSSTDPNLQNIPVRTELGKHIRTAFVAAPGNVLVSADYSQFELRLAAVLAEDTELVTMFNNGVDIHTATAAQVQGRELEDVTKQMRSAAKTVNFGILYGMSPHGLSIATGMTYEQSIHFIERYKELRRPLFDYMDKIREQARKDGYVETLFGRRRPMPDIHSSNFAVRSAAERAAINMPIQGTEADLMKLAMINVDTKLATFNKDRSTLARQLLQIHDSILVECAEADGADIARLLKTEMEAVYSLPVELRVDTTIGENWGKL